MSSAAREKLYGVVVFVVVFVAVVGYGRLARWRAEQAAVAEREAAQEALPEAVRAEPEQEGDSKMGYFGNKGFTGTDAGVEDTMILASLFPAGGGAALTTDLWAGSTPPTWPNWPAALGQNAGELGETNCSIWASYENDQITEAQAYIWISAHPELAAVPVAVGVYSEAGQFLGKSDAVTLTPDDPAWVVFPFSTPVAIDTTKNYYLCIWQAFPPDMIYTSIKVGDYSGPVKISVSNVVEVASAGVAFEINTTVKTIRDVVVAADEPIGFRHSLTVNDAVVADASQTPTLVSPCFGRYIELETMLRISTPRQVSSEGAVTPPDPLPPDDTEETPETDQIITQSRAAVSGASGSTCTRGS